MRSDSLEGCRVIVTRPADQAELLAEPLRARGAQVRVRPLVRIAPPADGGVELEAALGRLADYDWVVFTSANAVRACRAQLPALRPAGAGRPEAGLAGAPDWPRGPRVACVGSATARAAEEQGLEVALVPQTYTGAALAQAMRAAFRLEGARVLWPRASGADPALGEALAAAGAEVSAVEAYRTVPDEEAARALRAELAGSPADVVAFTSPSAVRAFTAAGGSWDGAVAVIGSVTGRAARAAGLAVAVEPEQYTTLGLVEALERWWGEHH